MPKVVVEVEVMLESIWADSKMINKIPAESRGPPHLPPEKEDRWAQEDRDAARKCPVKGPRFDYRIHAYHEYMQRLRNAFSSQNCPDFDQLGVYVEVKENVVPKGWKQFHTHTGWYETTEFKEPSAPGLRPKKRLARFPRLGAFEVTVVCSGFPGIPGRFEAWSKIKSKLWPNTHNLAHDVAHVLAISKFGTRFSNSGLDLWTIQDSNPSAGNDVLRDFFRQPEGPTDLPRLRIRKKQENGTMSLQDPGTYRDLPENVKRQLQVVQSPMLFGLPTISKNKLALRGGEIVKVDPEARTRPKSAPLVRVPKPKAPEALPAAVPARPVPQAPVAQSENRPAQALQQDPHARPQTAPVARTEEEEEAQEEAFHDETMRAPPQMDEDSLGVSQQAPQADDEGDDGYEFEDP